MRLLRFSVLLAAGALAAQTPPPAQSKTVEVDLRAMKPEEMPPGPEVKPGEENKVVITMGDQTITVGEYMTFAEAVPANLRQFARSTNRGRFGENLIKTRLLAQEARLRKLDEDPKFKKLMELQYESLLAVRLQETIAASVEVDEAKLRDFYGRHQKEYERVRARHILIRYQGSAVPPQQGRKDLAMGDALAKIQDLRRRIVAGEDFAGLATVESDDINSARNGGDLDFFKRGTMDPQFEEVAFALEPGQVSEPVRTAYGFHLIRVEGKELKTIEELKPELDRRARMELTDTLLRQIVEKTPVTYDETFFGPGAIPMAKPAK
jgi:hypothetical protein